MRFDLKKGRKERTKLLGQLGSYRTKASLAHREPVLLFVTPHDLTRQNPRRFDVSFRCELLNGLADFIRFNVQLKARVSKRNSLGHSQKPDLPRFSIQDPAFLTKLPLPGANAFFRGWSIEESIDRVHGKNRKRVVRVKCEHLR